MEKVLITGATGFIGSALTRALLRRGDHVRVLVRDPARLEAADLEVHETVTGDITDPEAIRRAVRGVDKVYAIAGTFRELNLSDADYRRVNIDAARHLVEAAAEAGVKRLVHCSTCGIHGDAPRGTLLSEEHPFDGRGIYEETKAQGDRLVRDLGRELGLSVAVIRPTPVYGPGDTRLLKLFKMANKDRVLLLGPCTGGYHLVYIDDLVDAFILAGDKPEAHGQAFLIGGDEIPQVRQLVQKIAALFGKDRQKIVRLPARPFWIAGLICETVCRPLGISPPIFRRRIDFFTNNRAFDIAKARRLLDYNPRVGTDAGLRKTIDWYRQQGLI